MNEHPPPPPPRRIVFLQTTTGILKQTTSIFSTTNNLLMFLLLSLFLLYLRASVDSATDFLTSFIDNDPSIKPLIYRIHGPPNHTTIITRRHPFPELPHVPILDDGYFSEDGEFHRRAFDSSLPKPQLNATSFIIDSFDPQFGYSSFVSDNGIRASEIVRSSAKTTFGLIEFIEKEENDVIDGSNADFQSILKGFDLEHHDFTALLILIGAFSASYWFMVLGFVATYSRVHGIIFVVVLNNFCKRQNSFDVTFSNGSFLGVKRLSDFIAMRWVVRDALTQLLGVLFFVSIKDRYSLLKIFLRYKFMPYSFKLPRVKGFKEEIDDFRALWILIDFFISYVFVVAVWIVMANSRRKWREVVKESCHLQKLKIGSAINLKFLEGIVCRSVTRVVTRQFGLLFGLAFQSFMEVYFMVAWMVYYLSVKSIDDDSSGQPFGQRELEAMLVDV